ncbi:MAG: MarR family transcriptional regulator [Planctomycetota bacterium]
MARKQESQIDKLEILLANIRRKIHSIPTKQIVYKDVTFAQLKVIRFLSHKTNAPMTDIAQALSVALPTATGLVDNLVHNGYLKRYHQASDRRLVHVALSVKGRKLLNAISKRQRERLIKISDSMTSADRKRFIGALKTLDNLLDKSRQL